MSFMAYRASSPNDIELVLQWIEATGEHRSAHHAKFCNELVFIVEQHRYLDSMPECASDADTSHLTLHLWVDRIDQPHCAVILQERGLFAVFDPSPAALSKVRNAPVTEEQVQQALRIVLQAAFDHVANLDGESTVDHQSLPGFLAVSDRTCTTVMQMAADMGVTHRYTHNQACRVFWAAPDTATPDTATPDTATPDTATPDTATPDTAAPATPAPATPAPATPAPATPAPANNNCDTSSTNVAQDLVEPLVVHPAMEQSDAEQIGPCQYRIQPATLEQLDIIHSHWPYRTYSLSRSCFGIFICNFPSACVFRIHTDPLTNQTLRIPVAWTIVYSSGAIGALHVVQSCRRRGLAAEVVRYLTRHWCHPLWTAKRPMRLDAHSFPYAWVAVANLASTELFRRAGFRTSDTDLVHFVIAS
jgi:hypothetical protein